MSDPITVEKFAVGQSVRRIEDPRLVQGLGRYSDDVTLAREAHAVIARSPHAHARLRGVDATAALKAPGVIAVALVVIMPPRLAEGCGEGIDALKQALAMRTADPEEIVSAAI